MIDISTGRPAEVKPQGMEIVDNPYTLNLRVLRSDGGEPLVIGRVSAILAAKSVWWE